MPPLSKIISIVCVMLALFISTKSVFAQEEDGAYPLVNYTVQAGVDAWRFSTPEPHRGLVLPNNSTWRYRAVSPWSTIDANAWVSNDVVLNLKARANQGMGSHLDDLSVTWTVSPRFGVNAGVVSYKTTWCRTYETDSPWVHEVNPSCTVKVTSESLKGAPGLQAHASTYFGSYVVQGLVGVYRPLLWGYNTKDFANLTIENEQVQSSRQASASLSVLNLSTGSELRLGLLRTDQLEIGTNASGAIGVDKKYDVIFLGASFDITPKLHARLQSMRHDLNAGQLGLAMPSSDPLFSKYLTSRRLNSIELGYRFSGVDSLAVAFSDYKYDGEQLGWRSQNSVYVPIDNYTYHSQAMGATWRRNWFDGFFTAVQWQYSKMDERMLDLQGMNKTDAGAHAIGMRLGYKF